MVYLQIPANEALEFAKYLQQEVQKNPNGFITIDIKSNNEITDHKLLVPSVVSASEDIINHFYPLNSGLFSRPGL